MPTVVWTSMYYFLIAEIAMTAILALPVPIRLRNGLAKRINRLKLGERLLKPILFIAVALVMALIESYVTHERIMNRLLQQTNGTLHGPPDHHHIHTFHNDKERKYKAERNMYLAGFSLTLLFVIGRITQLMQESIELVEASEQVGRIFGETVVNVVEPNVDDTKVNAPTEPETNSIEMVKPKGKADKNDKNDKPKGKADKKKD